MIYVWKKKKRESHRPHWTELYYSKAQFEGYKEVEIFEKIFKIFLTFKVIFDQIDSSVVNFFQIDYEMTNTPSFNTLRKGGMGFFFA